MNRLPSQAYRVLLGCTVCQLGLGCSYIFGPLLKSVVAEFEWSRAAFSAGSGPMLLSMALSFPLVGHLADRYGARSVLSGAVLLLGTAFVLMSRIESVFEFYLINVLVGMALAGLGDVAVGAVASRWVAGGRGLALGLVYVGSNIGGAIVPGVAAHFTATGSWRTALAVVGVGAVALILPFAAFVVREPPAGYAAPHAAPEPDGGEDDLDLGAALRTRSFWALAFVLFAFYFYYVALIQHLVPFLSDLGFSDARAASRLSFQIAVGIAAKLAIGALADRIPVRSATLLNFAILTGASWALLAVGAPGVLTGFLLAQGFATAAENVLLPLLVADCFGVRHMARIYGVLMLTLLAGALGQVFAGLAFDRFGSYDFAFTAFAVLNVAALGALLLVRDERNAGSSPRWT